jgi:hypothetical protein
MYKQHAGKAELSPSGCIFDGLPVEKLQRIRTLQAAHWRTGRTQHGAQQRTTSAATRAA